MTKGKVSVPAAHLLKDTHPSIMEADCLCGCDYAVSNYALLQLVTIAVTSLVKSLMVAFRCLKGLRNAQWANLITVLFNIPINIYPVTWASIDAELPPGVTEETETQGEPAFDPF
ncbi:rnz, partial [Symbiodinium sp. CCMP2456]